MQISFAEAESRAITEGNEEPGGFEPSTAVIKRPKVSSDPSALPFKLLPMLYILLIGQEIAKPRLGQIVQLPRNRFPCLFKRQSFLSLELLPFRGHSVQSCKRPPVKPVGDRDRFKKFKNLLLEFCYGKVWLVATIVETAPAAVIIRIVRSEILADYFLGEDIPLKHAAAGQKPWSLQAEGKRILG